MEIRQLATFIRVAQFNSFSRAAESLGYSQSAVTVQIRQLEVDRGVSFLPWYAVESGVQQGRLIRLSVEDCYISLYRQIFCHKEKWRTREMDEFVRVAKLADE
ncbi:LysR family transcriptional regulator [Agathobaculum hominis]|uniref:LysR family transcriptional regulator n=1 Tax=Agathobaculum hominis TaxID=2763014 RepID=A0ABR7GLC9_9FIRM|nr:LysR family transcriptional regulator [Agathobaculum hominis]MBC5695119.1 LysR family transcriptional regulator [Agathobaculum hominis]